MDIIITLEKADKKHSLTTHTQKNGQQKKDDQDVQRSPELEDINKKKTLTKNHDPSKQKTRTETQNNWTTHQ